MLASDLTLETSKVLLRPVDEKDFDTFLQLAQDDDMWHFFAFNLAERSNMRKWMDTAHADLATKTRLPFTIIDKATGKIAGSMSLMNISWHDLRVEIGNSWLGKEFRSSGINKHSKFLMMDHMFGKHSFERIEFKTDVLNARARKGLQKIGGIEEGVFRSHMTMWNNRRRDSVYYSVLRSEWPALKLTIFKDIA